MISDIISAVSAVIAAVSVFITVKQFNKQQKQEKFAATTAEISKIFSSYYDKGLGDAKLNEHYCDFVGYMSQISRFAAYYNKDVYDKDLTNERMSILMKENYNSFMERLIEDRRKQFSRENYYSEIETMLLSMGIISGES